MPSEIKKEFEEYRGRISRISNLVLEEMLSLTENIKGKEWSDNFKKALSELSEEEKINIKDEDNLLKIALIWGASENNQENFFKYLANKYKESQNWAVICSLASSPLCPPDILDYFGRGIAKEKGYGYILRVIARNKNTPLETLKNIAEDFKFRKKIQRSSPCSFGRWKLCSK
ncbi:MAG: hypothetical protein QW273_03975 [Candidatus Pacearchaeota archaeon]